MIRFNKEKNKNEIALVEIFKSIDGEAFHSGQPTVFIRTFKCSLHCIWCDTLYSLNEEEYKKTYNKDLIWMTAEEIFNKTEELEKNYKYKSICLTGGEPLMKENEEFMIKEMIPLFIKAGYAVNIETNGAEDYKPYKDAFGEPEILDAYGNRKGVTIIADYKLPYSKMNKLMNKDNLKIYSENDIIKMVISDAPEDWEELENLCKSGTKAKLYLSPCFGEVTMSKIPEFIINHPQYNITAQIQAHKVFWAPDEIGV